MNDRSGSQISVAARLETRPGTRETVEQLLRELVDSQTMGEPGTQLFIISRSADEPDVLLVYELYRDAEARAAHHSSERFLALSPRIRDLLVDARLDVGNPVFGKRPVGAPATEAS